jgi:hypothetical protein
MCRPTTAGWRYGEIFSVRVGELWNAVPSDIKRAGSAKSFKDAYMKFRHEMIRN